MEDVAATELPVRPYWAEKYQPAGAATVEMAALVGEEATEGTAASPLTFTLRSQRISAINSLLSASPANPAPEAEPAAEAKEEAPAPAKLLRERMAWMARLARVETTVDHGLQRGCLSTRERRSGLSRPCPWQMPPHGAVLSCYAALPAERLSFAQEHKDKP